MSIDWKKPIQTRGGRKARVLCTDLKGKRPIVVAVEYPRQEVLYLASEGGCCRPGSVGLDIVNVPPRRPHADVIKAWAEGAEVEFRTGPDFDWRTIDRPVFTPELEYRVKP